MATSFTPRLFFTGNSQYTLKTVVSICPATNHLPRYPAGLLTLLCSLGLLLYSHVVADCLVLNCPRYFISGLHAVSAINTAHLSITTGTDALYMHGFDSARLQFILIKHICPVLPAFFKRKTLRHKNIRRKKTELV